MKQHRRRSQAISSSDIREAFQLTHNFVVTTSVPRKWKHRTVSDSKWLLTFRCVKWFWNWCEVRYLEREQNSSAKLADEGEVKFVKQRSGFSEWCLKWCCVQLENNITLSLKHSSAFRSDLVRTRSRFDFRPDLKWWKFHIFLFSAHNPPDFIPSSHLAVVSALVLHTFYTPFTSDNVSTVVSHRCEFFAVLHWEILLF